ncbi:hypothetical protein [Halosimplex halobium]
MTSDDSGRLDTIIEGIEEHGSGSIRDDVLLDVLREQRREP